MQLRRLLAGAIGLTFGLMLLGVYTAAVGAGLTCEGQWPFCDGWLGLFPADWLSFVEWFHRLVAMVTGVALLGVTGLAWKRSVDRRIRWGLVGAVVLLPVQIALGALTVTLGGLFPWGYSPPVQAAHFLAATLIFTAVVGATALACARIDPDRLRLATLAAVAVVPIQYLFSFGTVFAYTPIVQTIYYALSLSLFGLLVALVVWTGDRRRRLVLGGAGSVLALQMLVGRHLLGSPDRLLSDVLSVLLFASLGVATWLAYRADGESLPVVGSLAGR